MDNADEITYYQNIVSPLQKHRNYLLMAIQYVLNVSRVLKENSKEVFGGTPSRHCTHFGKACPRRHVVGEAQVYPIVSAPIWHHITCSPLEGHPLGNTFSPHFPHPHACRDTLYSTASHCMHWRGTSSIEEHLIGHFILFFHL